MPGPTPVATPTVRFAAQVLHSPAAGHSPHFASAVRVGGSPHPSSPLASPGQFSPRPGMTSRKSYFDLAHATVAGSPKGAVASPGPRTPALTGLGFSANGRGLGLMLDMPPPPPMLSLQGTATQLLSRQASEAFSESYGSDATTITAGPTPVGTPYPRVGTPYPRAATPYPRTPVARSSPHVRFDGGSPVVQAYRRQATPYPRKNTESYFDTMSSPTMSENGLAGTFNTMRVA